MTYQQKYRLANLERIRARERAQHARNKEKRNQQSREYRKRVREQDPEGERKKRQEYYQKNRERIRAKDKAWREASPKRRRHERDLNLRRYYGITIEQYDAMHEAQGGLCAICGRPESVLRGVHGRAWTLAVDHDRETGAVRELLCSICNRSLGLFQHNPEILDTAAAYLRKHQPPDSALNITRELSLL